MSFSSISSANFLEQRNTKVIIDVRSPGEFEKAHIPNAINLPLFSNEERAMVGTTYTRQGKDIAVELGLKYVGPKLHRFVQKARKYSGGHDLIIHCWRGGMRSASMAWLLDTAGFNVTTLRGGYKTYRKLCQEQFEMPRKMVVLSGATGSGKTEVLRYLKRLGEQVVDLEGIANHKGSAFGALGQEPQPSTEMFENLLFEELLKLDPSRPVWLEDESASIGTVFIPNAFYKQMGSSPILYMNIPKEIRVERLIQEYGCFSNEQLVGCIQKIEKRLGTDNAQVCISAVESGDLRRVAEMTLSYYDKSYSFSLEKRSTSLLYKSITNDSDMEKNAASLILEARAIKFRD